MDDPKSFGVNVSGDMADAIEAPLQYGDSRSERIRELVRMGLAAEKALERRHMVDSMDAKEKADLIEQAVYDELGDETGKASVTASS